MNSARAHAMAPAALIAVGLALGLLQEPVAATAQVGTGGSEIARVQDDPILRSDFNHWLRVANSSHRKAPSEGNCALPRPGAGLYGREKTGVVEFLLSARWIRGEAAERAIKVTPHEIRRHREYSKKLVFGSDKAYRRFLRESCQTQRDVNYRVRIDLLESRIERQVMAGKHGAELQQAIDSYRKGFYDKWKARTTCAAGFIVEECSNFAGR